MKFSAIVATLALGSGVTALTKTQQAHANAIIAKAKADGVGMHGCQAGIATAIVEVGHSSIPPES